MTKKLLIVDDEPDILRLIVLALKKKNFDIATATDGQEALDVIRKVSPDLVLLDIMLPKITGDQVCTTIKGDPELNQIPVILFTADSDTVTAEKARQYGAVDYIIKPFDTEQLIQKNKTGSIPRVPGGGRILGGVRKKRFTLCGQNRLNANTWPSSSTPASTGMPPPGTYLEMAHLR